MKELAIALPLKKLTILNLSPGDIRRTIYNLLVLCHDALEADVDSASLNEDDSDYHCFNSFISKEILEPTLEMFIQRLTRVKEMHAKYRTN